MPRLLLVEDDPVIGPAVRIALGCEGFAVDLVASLAQARAAVRAQRYDAAVVDLDLPDGDGRDLCAELATRAPRVASVVITADAAEATALATLGVGADDHMRKPFGVRELAARLRRCIARHAGGAELRCGSLTLDPATRRAAVRGRELALGRKEFDLLALLAERAGEAVSRDAALDAIDGDAALYDRTIDSHISHLRRKLRDGGADDVAIAAVYGVGYRLEVG